KMHDLQEHEFGEIKKSIALNSQQIQEILQHSRIDYNNSVNLLYCIFIHLSILLVMHNGEHYQLKIDQFKIDKHNGDWYKKNHVGKNKLINFMHEIKCITQINISIELLTNYSGQKTAAQCLQDNDISEQAIMQLTGHRSI
ncbi:8978_t:CDS:2, partial [Cetraspora pellucida]